jgi:hypothetical protein
MALLMLQNLIVWDKMPPTGMEQARHSSRELRFPRVIDELDPALVASQRLGHGILFVPSVVLLHASTTRQ